MPDEIEDYMLIGDSRQLWNVASIHSYTSTWESKPMLGEKRPLTGSADVPTPGRSWKGTVVLCGKR
jgi:hypothetical protein